MYEERKITLWDVWFISLELEACKSNSLEEVWSSNLEWVEWIIIAHLAFEACVKNKGGVKGYFDTRFAIVNYLQLYGQSSTNFNDHLW